jgi:hypothetical protein
VSTFGYMCVCTAYITTPTRAINTHQDTNTCNHYTLRHKHVQPLHIETQTRATKHIQTQTRAHTSAPEGTPLGAHVILYARNIRNRKPNVAPNTDAVMMGPRSVRTKLHTGEKEEFSSFRRVVVGWMMLCLVHCSIQSCRLATCHGRQCMHGEAVASGT